MTTSAQQQSGAMMREDFGGKSLSISGETQASAMQAAATAAVQARFVVAMQRPRSWDDVRVRILNECKRPGFAETARYHKPIGQGVEGPSIRFAEACMRYAGNLSVETMTLLEDDRKRLMRVTAIDYETNASFSSDIAINKVVERKNASGRSVVGERRNSYGQTVYLIEATDDEVLNVQNALVSKAARTLILRLIPGDIVEEGQQLCVATIKDQAAKDPAGARKRLCDGFAAIGVMPADLERYLGHAIATMQPAEFAELRQVYATVRDGETTWGAVMAGRGGEGEPAKKASIADKVKAKAATRDKAKPVDRAAKTEPAPASSAATAPTEPAPATSSAKADPHDPETGELADDEGDRGDNPDDY